MQNMNNSWISVESGLPSEHVSMFAKYKGTLKWRKSMFESISEKVLITVEFLDETRIVTTGCTQDHEWFAYVDVPHKVIAWMYLPEPYMGI